MKPKNHTFTVAEGETKRLDAFLVEKLGFSRSQIQKFIKDGQVLINEESPKKSGQTLRVGETVAVIDAVDTPVADTLILPSEASSIQLNVVTETPDYLVINKPSGILVHPTEAGETNTLVHHIISRYPDVVGVGEKENRPGIVHRLDRNASGLLVVARNQAMFDSLKEQFKTQKTEKEYIVLVHGVIPREYDMLDFDIDRGKDGKMVARPKTDANDLSKLRHTQPGKKAKTELWVDDLFVNHSLLRVRIHSGRTHQIRVHMFAYNHPVVGDDLYFQKKMNRKKDKELGRLFLHAAKLCFFTLAGEKVCFEAPLPKELQVFLENLA